MKIIYSKLISPAKLSKNLLPLDSKWCSVDNTAQTLTSLQINTIKKNSAVLCFGDSPYGEGNVFDDIFLLDVVFRDSHGFT